MTGHSPATLFFALMWALLPVTGRGEGAVQLPAVETTEGYVTRLLINEVPFPGERGYKSEQETMAAMDQLLIVLDRRLRSIPAKYTQQQIAGTKASDIIDVITVGGLKGQFDGFYRNEAGLPAMVPRIGDRIDHLTRIANTGQPGKFARLLNYAGQIATSYAGKATDPRDRHAGIKQAGGIPATGGSYSWMTDETRFHPGGNYLRIEDAQQGSLGGNRFFTLREEPK